MTLPTEILVKLARQSASTWNAMAEEMFRGVAQIETANTVYRFIDGVFASSAQKPSREFEYSNALSGIRLIGFLTYLNGFWSLSPRWREGACAVLWKPGRIDERSFLVTSATATFALEAPKKEPRKTVSISGVVRRSESRPPTLRRPAPPSMTRVLPAKASIGDLR